MTSTTQARARRSPWVMVGWLSAIVGLIVVVFLATNMTKDPEGRAEEKIPAAAAPQ
jgi:hypothetical protein